MRLLWSRHFLVLSSCFVIIHFAFFCVYGIRSFYDSTVYLRSADYLLAHGVLEEAHHVFYAIPIALIALCQSVFSGAVPFLVLQIVISGMATACLYKASDKIFQSRTAAFLSVLIFLFWWDNLHWNSTIMTESVFCSLICFLTYRLVVFENKRSDWIFILIFSLALVFTRPTGILIAIGVGVFFLCTRWKSLSPMLRPAIVGCCVIVAALGAYTMFSIWDFTDQYHKGNIVTYADVAAEKQLVYDGLQIEPGVIASEHASLHPAVKMMRYAFTNPYPFLKATGMKIGYLLSATRPYYSWQHNLFSFVWLALVYTLFCFGYRMINPVPFKGYIITIIALNCVLIGISSVDWDNRFYVPMFPLFALVAGGGGAYLFNRVQSV